MNWLGDYPEDFTTVSVYFTTHDTNGAPIAPLSAFEADDVKIYKDGNAAQKTTTNGLTMTSPFDSITGLHRLLIDTSNDTGDSGFWVGGHVYSAVLNPDTETVNGQAPLKVIGTFGLALAANGGASPTAATIADAVWDEARSGHVTSGTFGEGAASVQGNVTGSVGSVASGGITATSIAADAIGASELATDAAEEIADALLDRSAGVETGVTFRQAMRLILAALAGKASGLATTTAVYRDTNDTKDRITATVDTNGNRSAVTLDAS